jgi:hypothetical protein
LGCTLQFDGPKFNVLNFNQVFFKNMFYSTQKVLTNHFVQNRIFKVIIVKFFKFFKLYLSKILLLLKLFG